MGEKLKGASVTHNHPIGSDNDYTFSTEDLSLFLRFKLSLLRGVDEKYVYELNRNVADIEEINWNDLESEQEDGHFAFIIEAKKRGLGYRRWQRE